MKNYSELIEKLEDKRVELLERLRRIKISKRKPHDTDSAEQAIERENDDVVDALGENIRIELREIDKALLRIEKEEYNICSICQETISPKRLEALPYADRCINCASS